MKYLGSIAVLLLVFFTRPAFGNEFVVDTTMDLPDVSPGNGVCATVDSNGCSLRAAVMEANALGSENSIKLPAGTFLLTLPGTEDLAASGDLDVTTKLTIRGVSSEQSIIDAAGESRIFQLFVPPAGEASLSLFNLTLRNGRASSPEILGGAILANLGGLLVNRVRFEGNHANAGGAIYLVDPTDAIVDQSVFVTNGCEDLGVTNQIGAAISAMDGQLTIRNTTFDGNTCVTATVHVDGTDLSIFNSTFSGNQGGPLPGLRVKNANAKLVGTTFYKNLGAAVSFFTFDGSQSVRVGSSLLDNTDSGTSVCDGDALTSLGHNQSSDSSCGFAAMGDREDTPADLLPLADNGGPVPTHAPSGTPVHIDQGDPGIPGSPSGIDCGYRDARGMARPQDGDADGQATCDVGAFELQNGPDIGPPMSGPYFDPSRNGEGIFVEMLPGKQAVVYLFTYAPDGSGRQTWMLGVGNVLGNSIVVDEMSITHGGIFGPGFDPSTVVFDDWGPLSISFPDCNAGMGNPGILSLPGRVPDYSAVQVKAQGLGKIVACSSAQNKSINNTLSGSFFDPSHDGEGIILEVLTSGTVVLQWFTYDNTGKQVWIQALGVISGNTIQFDAAFTTRGATWGSGYDPDDVEQVPWGTITLDFADCNNAQMTYTGPAGFGAGSQNLIRLTKLDGVTCSL